MSNPKQPKRANGKICYVEIPAFDIKHSASFYREVFGWKIREDADGNVSFDDTAGEVSGMWVTGRQSAAEPGLLISIMVEDIGASLDAVATNGGEIVQPTLGGSEKTALFRDPAGNVFCLYQSRMR